MWGIILQETNIISVISVDLVRAFRFYQYSAKQALVNFPKWVNGSVLVSLFSQAEQYGS